MAMRKTVKRGPPPGKVRGTRLPAADSPTTAGWRQAELEERAKGPKFDSLIGVAVAKSRRTLPRGAKFVIRDGKAQLRVDTKRTGTVLFEGDIDDVARWALRKLGYKAEIKAA